MKDEERFGHLHTWDPNAPSWTRQVLQGMAIGGMVGVAYHLLKNGGITSTAPEGGLSDSGVTAAIQEYEPLVTKDYNPDLAIWAHPKEVRDQKLAAILKVHRDPKAQKQQLKLASRWIDLCKRSRVVGYCPTVSMPRSVSGDIAGPPKLLERQMDKIEKQLEMLEKNKQIDKRWLET